MMKKNNTKKNNTARKLLPAAGMLAVSASMLATSTYAWFTMNREVTVTGMTMYTKVSENLLIADDTIGSTAAKGDSAFNNSLVQLVDGLIEPVSTVNGKDFFYTAGNNVQGNGAVLNKAWSAYDVSTEAKKKEFTDEYALEGADAAAATGYIDYVYQLKAINGATASEIRLTGLDLTYGGTGDNGQKATRVAVFAEDLGYKTGADASTYMKASVGTVDNAAVVLKAIYTPSGAANFSSAEGVSASIPDAVSAANARADVTYNEQFALSVGANQTQYYKIIVRVWLEGEDNTCNNTTFMDLRDKWSLDMKWDFVATSESAAKYNKVSNVALANTATKTALLTTDTVAGTAAYTISGISYYEITGKTLGTAKLYATDATLTVDSKVYTISADGLYPTNVTNQVTITADT
jgi:hypothetical protein